MVGTLLEAAADLGVIEAARHGAPLEPTFWALLVPLAGLTAVWPNLRLSCVTLIVAVLVSGGDGLSFDRPLDRVAEILLGTLASIVVAVLFALASRDGAA